MTTASPVTLSPYTARRIRNLLAAGVLFACLMAAALGCNNSSGQPPAIKNTPAATQTTTQAAAKPVKVESGQILFEDVTVQRGLQYVWPMQPRPMRNLEAFGRGCAFLDYDDDGWQDILLVASPHVILYRNRGSGQYEDVTSKTSLDAVQGDWKGVAVGDYDGDGYLDLVLTGYRRLALLKGSSAGAFSDTTTEAGLDPTNRNHWGSSAALMDLDGDNRLDLVILNYVIFGPKEPQYCELAPKVRSGCPPSRYRPEFGEVWQNVGGKQFRDVTASSGFKHTNGKALVIAFCDFDDDGHIDFYVGNDGTPADALHNLGGMRLKNIGEQSGLATTPLGHAMAAMGADWADFDHDGRLDLTVTGFADETYALVRAMGKNLFVHVNDTTGISGPTSKPLGFGAKWLDFENDGWPDISYANGHVYDNAEQIDPLSTYRQPIMLFHNQKGQWFQDLVPGMGGDVARPLVGRGSATGDIDNDGRIDLLVVDYEGRPMLLHNTSQTSNHWVTFDLRGTAPNTFAYGARITAHAGKQIWLADVGPASSYLSSSDPRIHFGLGGVTKLDSVTIRWSAGKKETFTDVPIDKVVKIQQGRGIVEGVNP